VGKGYLIDTNVVIDYLDNKLPASGMSFMHRIVDSVPNVSVITKIEVLRFNAPAKIYQTYASGIIQSLAFRFTEAITVSEASIARPKHSKTMLTIP